MQQRQAQSMIDRAIKRNKINFDNQSAESLNVRSTLMDCTDFLSQGNDAALGKNAAAYHDKSFNIKPHHMSMERRKTFQRLWNKSRSLMLAQAHRMKRVAEDSDSYKTGTASSYSI